MKKNKKNWVFLLGTTLIMLTTACEKQEASDGSLILKKTTSKEISLNENDRLIFFLSKTLNVKESEIKFDSNQNKFVVLGKLEFPLSQISERYSNANEFKSNNNIKN